MHALDSLFINSDIQNVDIHRWIAEYRNIFECDLTYRSSNRESGRFKTLSFVLDDSIVSTGRSASDLRGDLSLAGDKSIFIIAVVSGELSLGLQDESITCRRGHAVAFDSASVRHIDLLAGTSFCLLKVGTADIAPLLERLAGRRPVEPLRIAAVFDISSGAGRMLAAMLAAVATGASANGTTAISPHAAHFLQSSLISLVLENVPHNYTRDRPREQAENIPLQIRRATEYILAHAQETIAVQDVAHAAGIGLRTLQQNFQKFFQTSPQDYIRTAKLRGARRDLEDPNSLLSVEEIARKWGFGNRGHFAAQYRKLYRERPSETRSTR